MDTAYGVQSDAWGALIPERASLVSQLEQGVHDRMDAKGLPKLHYGKQQVALEGSREAREHMIFSQDLGGGGWATVALRIAQRGAQDLEVSWRLFEKNTATSLVQAGGQTSLTILGILFICVGIPLVPLAGAGIIG